MKKLFTLIIVTALLASLLVGCAPATKQNNKISAPNNILAFSGASIGRFLTAFQGGGNTATSAKLLSSDEDNSTQPLDREEEEEVDIDDAEDDESFDHLKGEKGEAADDDDDFKFSKDDKQPTEEDIDLINSYIMLVESLLGNNPIECLEEKSDKEGYEYKVTLTSRDLAGNVMVFVLYFNQTPINAESEVDEEDDDLSNKISDAEKEFQLEGIMLVNGLEYSLKGKKEVEQDGYEFSLMAVIDSKNFIKLVQEVEEGEEKIFYSIHEEGKQVQRFLLEVENEEDESEIVIMSTVDGKVSHIRMNKEVEDDETIINILVKVDRTTIRCKAKVTTDENGEKVYEYEFNNGSFKRNNKNGDHKHHGKAKISN